MADGAGSQDFVYVQTDIPAGMTIGEWRAQRAAERRRRAEASRRGRSRLARVRALAQLLRSAGRRIVWRVEVRHSSEAHESIMT